MTGRKQAEEGHELLAGEMSHRVKNLLAIATGLTRISWRSANSLEEMATSLIQRLTALDRAHDLVRPLPGGQGSAALLGDLLTVLLAPYDDQGAFARRIRVAVPRMGVGERAATTIALVIHELATNSVKHGALFATEGTLDVSAFSDELHLTLTWAEDGGPVVMGEPAMQGFGSKLISRSVAQQLDGSLSYDWQPSGLVACCACARIGWPSDRSDIDVPPPPRPFTRQPPSRPPAPLSSVHGRRPIGQQRPEGRRARPPSSVQAVRRCHRPGSSRGARA